jgi:hypothetical protein
MFNRINIRAGFIKDNNKNQLLIDQQIQLMNKGTSFTKTYKYWKIQLQLAAYALLYFLQIIVGK